MEVPFPSAILSGKCLQLKVAAVVLIENSLLTWQERGGGYLIEIEKMDFLKNFQNIWNISEKNINDKYLISKDSRLFKAGIIAN